MTKYQPFATLAASLSRLGDAMLRHPFARGRFASALSVTTARRRDEGAPPLPVRVHLQVGNGLREEVAAAYVTDPDTACADVAAVLHALANEIHPPTDPADEAAAPDPDDDEGPVRYRDADGDIWETVPGTSGPEQLVDIVTGSTSSYDHVLSQYGPLTVADHDEDQEDDQ
jgi:hypothetical protein